MRAKILEFAKAMDKQLDKNSHKDRKENLLHKNFFTHISTEGWHDCPPLYLEEKLLEEVAELLVLVAPHQGAEFWMKLLYEKVDEAERKPKGSVLEEAADASNLAFMLADNKGVFEKVTRK